MSSGIVPTQISNASACRPNESIKNPSLVAITANFTAEKRDSDLLTPSGKVIGDAIWICELELPVLALG
jgi:hypothetical protein